MKPPFLDDRGYMHHITSVAVAKGSGAPITIYDVSLLPTGLIITARMSSPWEYFMDTVYCGGGKIY